MVDPHRRILVLFAHPALDRSEVNKPLARATRRMEDVTFIDLYAEYPTLDIDVDREQARLLAHDVIVFMFPMYWYSTPAILKEWQDLVLEYGFAYGSGGTALYGKVFLCAITTGGHEEAYSVDGYNNFTIRQMLTPLEQTAELCGMIYLPPFALHGARRAADEGRVGPHVAEWRRLVESLRTDRIDYGAAERLERINEDLDHVLKEG